MYQDPTANWGSESLEGLNSSLVQADGELWLTKICPEKAIIPFEELWIFAKNGFFEPKFWLQIC